MSHSALDMENRVDSATLTIENIGNHLLGSDRFRCRNVPNLWIHLELLSATQISSCDHGHEVLQLLYAYAG